MSNTIFANDNTQLARTKRVFIYLEERTLLKYWNRNIKNKLKV